MGNVPSSFTRDKARDFYILASWYPAIFIAILNVSPFTIFLQPLVWNIFFIVAAHLNQFQWYYFLLIYLALFLSIPICVFAIPGGFLSMSLTPFLIIPELFGIFAGAIATTIISIVYATGN